jgi:hypothetical protein
LPIAFDFSKRLKQACKLLTRHPNTCISHREFHHPFFFLDWNCNIDWTLLGIFNSIG